MNLYRDYQLLNLVGKNKNNNKKKKSKEKWIGIDLHYTLSSIIHRILELVSTELTLASWLTVGLLGNSIFVAFKIVFCSSMLACDKLFPKGCKEDDIKGCQKRVGSEQTFVWLTVLSKYATYISTFSRKIRLFIFSKLWHSSKIYWRD